MSGLVCVSVNFLFQPSVSQNYTSDFDETHTEYTLVYGYPSPIGKVASKFFSNFDRKILGVFSSAEIFQLRLCNGG